MKLSQHTYQRLNVIAWGVSIVTTYFNRCVDNSYTLSGFAGMMQLSFAQEEIQAFLFFQKIYYNLLEPFDTVLTNNPDIPDCFNKKMLSPSAELIKKLKMQEALTEEKISELSYNAFPSFRDSAIFFYNFMESEDIYNLSKRLYLLSEQYGFLKDVQKQLEVAFFSTPRAIPPGLKVSIDHLNVFLQKIIDQREHPDHKLVNDMVSYCMDISVELHNLYRDKDYRLPSEEEHIRRKKISTTKLKQNAFRQKRVKEIILQIKRMSVSQTCKVACGIFLQKNREELATWGIHSARTLENLCSHTKPNLRRQEANNIDASRPIFDEKLLAFVTQNLPR